MKQTGFRSTRLLCLLMLLVSPAVMVLADGMPSPDEVTMTPTGIQKKLPAFVHEREAERGPGTIARVSAQDQRPERTAVEQPEQPEVSLPPPPATQPVSTTTRRKCVRR